uniref:torsin-4A isoform X2 n=1 Tax=Myxine glutinosa TaxID=7769 RepID=UPI00358EE436
MISPRLRIRSQTYRSTSTAFTFDVPVENGLKRRCRSVRNRKKRVLYPEGTSRKDPTQGSSAANYLLLFLLLILAFQVFNAIENLDDNLLRYDIDGLEKTLWREVLGQPTALALLVKSLAQYLSTHVHDCPVVLALHGPTGTGKSFVGRLIAKHFEVVAGRHLVFQLFARSHCPDDGASCASRITAIVKQAVQKAEQEEKVPLIVFDDVEALPEEVLDLLQILTGPNQPPEHLSAIYILISSLGHDIISDFVLRNASLCSLQPLELDILIKGHLASWLSQKHPLYSNTLLIPFGLLGREHIRHCFWEEMIAEGFVPAEQEMELLASELRYVLAGKCEYALTGCKSVVSRVNQMHWNKKHTCANNF